MPTITVSKQNPPPAKTRYEAVTVQGTPNDPPNVTLPTAQEGIVVPWMIGRQRAVSPNVMAYGNMKPLIERVTTTRTETTTEINPKYVEIAGGYVKPLQNPETNVVREIIEVTDNIVGYTVDAQVGLCLGKGDVRLRAIYESNTLVWQGNTSDATINVDAEFIGKSVRFYSGSLTQQADTLEGLTDIPAYVGISYARLNGMVVTGSKGQVSFELERHPNPLGLTAAQNVNSDGDINLATALYEAITDEWGGGGLPITQINTNSFKLAGEQLATEENYCSLWCPNDAMLKTVVEILENQAQGVVTQNKETGLIEFVLIRDSVYDPATTKHFDESSILRITNKTKDASAARPNYARATFTDRSADYATGVTYAETVSVTTRGGKTRRPTTFEYPAAYTMKLARKLIARDLARIASSSFVCQIELNRTAHTVRVGEIITVTYPKLRLKDYPLVVRRVRDTALNNNSVVLNCEQLTSLSGRAIHSPPEEDLFIDLNPSPQPPERFMMKDAPFYLAYIASNNFAQSMPMVLAERYNPVQTSMSIYLKNAPNSADPVLVKSVAPYCTYGKLSAAIGLTDGYVDGQLADITITGVKDATYIKSVGEAGLRAGEVLVFIDDEIFTYTGFTRLATGTYRLTGVRRALIDTVMQGHAVNADVWICSGFTSLPDRPITIGNFNPATGFPSTRLSNVVVPYSFNVPLTFSPEFVVTGNTYSRAGKYSDGINIVGWQANSRMSRTVRVHNTQINGTRNVNGISVAGGNTVTVSWRNRATFFTSGIPVMTDASEDNTVVIGHTVKVVFTDNAGTITELGSTTPYLSTNNDPAASSLQVTIPATAAKGLGNITAIASSMTYGVSLYNEKVPINIT